jgi:hypothetical protein
MAGSTTMRSAMGSTRELDSLAWEGIQAIVRSLHLALRRGERPAIEASGPEGGPQHLASLIVPHALQVPDPRVDHIDSTLCPINSFLIAAARNPIDRAATAEFGLRLLVLQELLLNTTLSSELWFVEFVERA